MAANTNPISPIAPASTGNVIRAAATPILTALNNQSGAYTLGTDAQIFFTAGANGSRVGRVRVNHAGINVASLMRFWLNNGNAPSTTTMTLLDELALGAQAAISATAKQTNYEVFLNVVLQPSWRLIYTLGTTVASGYHVSAPDAGDY